MAGVLNGTPGAARGLGAASILYIAVQLPVSIAGIGLLLLLACSGLARWRRGSRLEPPAAMLRAQPLVLVVAAVGAIGAVQAILLPNPLKPFTLAHLLAYAVVALAAPRGHAPFPALPLVRAVSVLNLMLLSTAFMPSVTEVFWFDMLDKLRFQSYYFEPSIAAVVFVLNTVILAHHGRGSREMPFLLCNLVCLLFTYSGSGMLLLGGVLLTQLHRVRAGVLLRYALAALVIGLPWALTEAGSAAVQQMIVDRAVGIATLEYDNSVHLRAVAPILFLNRFLEGDISTWLGAGIGGIESYVGLYQSDLWFMVDYLGGPVADINNGYVVVLALLGLPAGLAVLAAWLAVVWRSGAAPALKAYVLLYPVVSGFVINPFPWLLVLMVVGRPAAVPARPPLPRPSCASLS